MTNDIETVTLEVPLADLAELVTPKSRCKWSESEFLASKRKHINDFRDRGKAAKTAAHEALTEQERQEKKDAAATLRQQQRKRKVIAEEQQRKQALADADALEDAQILADCRKVRAEQRQYEATEAALNKRSRFQPIALAVVATAVIAAVVQPPLAPIASTETINNRLTMTQQSIVRVINFCVMVSFKTPLGFSILLILVFTRCEIPASRWRPSKKGCSCLFKYNQKSLFTAPRETER